MLNLGNNKTKDKKKDADSNFAKDLYLRISFLRILVQVDNVN